jgi:hypothetical protein
MRGATAAISEVSPDFSHTGGLADVLPVCRLTGASPGNGGRTEEAPFFCGMGPGPPLQNFTVPRGGTRGQTKPAFPLTLSAQFLLGMPAETGVLWKED